VVPVEVVAPERVPVAIGVRVVAKERITEVIIYFPS
jgi:hypothetical protein